MLHCVRKITQAALRVEPDVGEPRLMSIIRSTTMSKPADKTPDIRPLADAEIDHVSGAGAIRSGVINQSAISLPKPVYPPTA
jgi:hypothetical protein